MKNSFLLDLERRRSIYCLGNSVTQPKKYISDLVNRAIKLSPSVFNSQSARVVVLFGNHHCKLWALVKHELSKVLTSDALDTSLSKIDTCFASGFGTVLFFEDTAVVKELQQSDPLYADNIESWSEQANGMAQLSVWTALAAEHIGASLQHYNPIIDAGVAQEWSIPSTWRMIAQLPFGTIEKHPEQKSFASDEERCIIYE
ncbi:nitroreductase family protein [Vibrio sp.]|uniref:nitroreductase family protein n=1 Tax=Vibrio sp. TaxID=678 RepID=UPI00311FFEE3